MSPSEAIDQAIKAPKKRFTKEEAQAMLRKYGVLTRSNNISKAYKDIIIKTGTEKNGAR